MEAERLKKIVAAGISTAMLLLFILLSIMVYQMILIRKNDKRIADLNAEIAILEQQSEQTEDEIALWQNKWKIEEKARELGYLYEGDK